MVAPAAEDHDEVPPMPELEILLDLSWEKDGEEWKGHLHDLIRIGDESVFGGTEEAVFDQIEMTASDWHLRSTLVAQRTDDGRILCTIIDDQPTEDGDLPDQIAPWREAVLEAARRVGTVHPQAIWNALLAVCPHQRFGRLARGGARPTALVNESRLGPLLLVPAGMPMHEMAADPGYLLGDHRHRFTSYPLIVEGLAASHGERPGAPHAIWPMDEMSALQALHRVAALFSLAFGEHWVVRAEPVRIAPGERIEAPHLAFGSQSEPSPWAHGCAVEHTDGEAERRALPDWAAAAWPVLEREPALDDALTAYYEALAVGVQHPTVAALLLVTVIEGIGAAMTGTRAATANVRAALSTVLPADQVVATARKIYERRSQTAHRGALHGPEAALGYVFDSDFRIDPAEVFAQDELGSLNDIARAVLIYALTQKPVRDTA